VYVEGIRISQETHLRASTACYRDTFTFVFVENVRTSYETALWTFNICYGNNFTSLYVDDVCTSQETYVYTCTVCCGESFTFLSSHCYETNDWFAVVLLPWQLPLALFSGAEGFKILPKTDSESPWENFHIFVSLYLEPDRFLLEAEHRLVTKDRTRGNLGPRNRGICQ
jgi:hypothetical protein